MLTFLMSSDKRRRRKRTNANKTNFCNIFSQVVHFDGTVQLRCSLVVSQSLDFVLSRRVQLLSEVLQGCIGIGSATFTMTEKFRATYLLQILHRDQQIRNWDNGNVVRLFRERSWVRVRIGRSQFWSGTHDSKGARVSVQVDVFLGRAINYNTPKKMWKKGKVNLRWRGSSSNDPSAVSYKWPQWWSLPWDSIQRVIR